MAESESPGLTVYEPLVEEVELVVVLVLEEVPVTLRTWPT